jgi:hypothetical protein
MQSNDCVIGILPGGMPHALHAAALATARCAE